MLRLLLVLFRLSALTKLVNKKTEQGFRGPAPYFDERYEGIMINGELRYRVYNRCGHDIGVYVSNGQQSLNIKPNSFAVLSVNDILYIESICNHKKFFSAKMLVPVDDSGKELSLEELGGFSDESTEVHHSTKEIETNLKKPFNAFKSWINKIEDPVELHEIWEVGKKMDLPASKLKILKAKLPNRDLLEEDGSEE